MNGKLKQIEKIIGGKQPVPQREISFDDRYFDSDDHYTVSETYTRNGTQIVLTAEYFKVPAKGHYDDFGDVDDIYKEFNERIFGRENLISTIRALLALKEDSQEGEIDRVIPGLETLLQNRPMDDILNRLRGIERVRQIGEKVSEVIGYLTPENTVELVSSLESNPGISAVYSICVNGYGRMVFHDNKTRISHPTHESGLELDSRFRQSDRGGFTPSLTVEDSKSLLWFTQLYEKLLKVYD